MKKFLLSLAVFALGSNVMMAEDPIASIEFTKSSTAYAKVSAYDKEWSTNDGMWKFFAFNNNNNGWDFIAAGRKSTASSPYIASGVACPLPVSSIVFSVGDRLTVSNITSAKLLVADDAEFTKALVETSLELPKAKNSEWVVNVATPAANKFYKVQLEIDGAASSNGQALSLTKIALYQNKYASEDPQPVEYTKVNSIAEAKALASKTNVEINFPMTVAFVNYSNIFAYDAAGDFIQIYGSNTYENNSIIPAGWKGEYELYGDAPELKPESLPASTEKGNFVPKTVAAADITTALVNQVILIKNVVLAEASPSAKANFTGTADGVSLSLRNNYTLPSVEAGTYDITVVVTIYQNAPSLYVTNFTLSAGSSVAEIEGAESGEAVYFNLQGVKVAEPTNGVYIMVKGNKATKVYINK